ncbi:MAG: hypothetical protein HOZ81_41985 [Streptomyces sp.]|nr:hypothetical protein [Streptomyces sp.]
MAWGEVDGRAVLAVTGSDGTVRLHDPERRRPVRSLPGGGASTTAIAWGSLRGRPVVLTAHGDGPLLLRDAHQGVLLKTFASGDWVRAAAMGKIEGVPVVAAACNDGTSDSGTRWTALRCRA